MLQNIFKEILVTSFIGSVLTLILTICKPMTKKWFSSAWHYYMWLLVLGVMILPVKITMPKKAEPMPEPGVISQISAEKAPEKIQPAEQRTELKPGQKSNISDRTCAIKSFAESSLTDMAFIWFWGMTIFFILKLAGYFMFLYKLHKDSSVIACPELRRFTDKKIVTRTSDKISSPLMAGIFKPTLLLPKTAMTAEQLDHVLAHEMTHFKRRDILYKWFIGIVTCVHWFNPVIYYINNQVNTECEISCDSAVVKEMSAEQKLGYIETILALLAAGNSKTASLTTGMTGDKKTLKRRFAMIKQRKRVKKSTVIVSAAAAGALLFSAVFASGVLAAAVFEKKPVMPLIGSGKITALTGKPFYEKSPEKLPEDTENISEVTLWSQSDTWAHSQISEQTALPAEGSGRVLAALSIPTQNSAEAKIKSTVQGEEPYIGFEQLVLENVDVDKLKQTLNNLGMAETQNAFVDLTRNYTVKAYASEQTVVKADENGNISLYLSADTAHLFDVCFYDETGEDVGSYVVLANNENAYTFLGFEKDKSYRTEIKRKAKDNWAVEGNYIIY